MKRYHSQRSLKRKKPYIYQPQEKEESLIDLSLAKPTPPQPFKPLDDILDQKPEKPTQNFLTLPQSIVTGTLEEPDVSEKYADKKFPLPRSKQDLKTRAQKHLAVIPSLLAGEEEMLVYYTLAVEQRKQLKRKVMDQEDRDSITWKNHIGGFYGLERQHFVSSLILEQFSGLLRKSLNKTIVYWTPEGFSAYVLANEIILRIVMDDMGVSMDEAERLLKDTRNYGCFVADKVPFENDLETQNSLAKKVEKREKEKEEKEEDKEKEKKEEEKEKEDK